MSFYVFKRRNMNWSTKAYTLNVLIEDVAAVKGTGDTRTVLKQLSPRLGAESVKVSVIDSFLNGNLAPVLNGRGAYAKLGTTAKARLLKALRLRKKRQF